MANSRYDASALMHGMGADQEESFMPQWHSFSMTTRLGLILLKREGTLQDYSVESDRIRLVFAKNALQPLQQVLTPPVLLNAETLENPTRIALYVHGLEGRPDNFVSLAKALENDGWHPLFLAFPNNGPIEPTAEYLKEELIKLRSRFPQSRLIVAGHSMGGLISWKALCEAGDLGISDFFAFAVPFQGSALARYQPELNLISGILEILKGRILFGTTQDGDGNGEAIMVLQPNSPLRTSILEKPLPDSIRLHLIAGDAGPLEPARQTEFSERLEQWIELRKPDKSLAGDLRFVLGCREIYRGEGDGAATISSALWPENPTSKRIFPLSHLGTIKVEKKQDEVLSWIKSNLNSSDLEPIPKGLPKSEPARTP